MAKTVGCADFNVACEYRITAADNEGDLIVDTTVVHARDQHPELVSDEAGFRAAVRAQIRALQTTADRMAPSEQSPPLA